MPYLLQVDVVQVVTCVNRLYHPALGGVQVQGEERRLRHVQELGHRAWNKAVISHEGHFWLQHVPVEARRKERQRLESYVQKVGA